jgi:hypothetical protein
MQWAPKKYLWPKSSLERPVARHFVWLSISIWRAVCKLLKIQVCSIFRFVGIALGRERFTSGSGDMSKAGQVPVEMGSLSNLSGVPQIKSKTLSGAVFEAAEPKPPRFQQGRDEEAH